MAAACIVLNGPSCSGKSSIAGALQERWPRPLQSTRSDTFLAIKFNRAIRRLRRGRFACRSEWRFIAATHNLLKLHSYRLAAATS